MRILRGRWADTDLVSPGRRVRPTAEAVRDAWLNWIEDDLEGARVLELFAGTGALGLEALSRGAASVDFVESGAPALHALKANVAKLRVKKGATRIFKRDAIPYCEALPEGRYDLCLADPPFGSRMADRIVRRWLEVPYATVLAVETAADHARLPGKGRRRTFDASSVTVYRR